jgi:2-dehydro-3-deoxyphosphooctonate aldolase (KDO 8-P synthase)
MSAALAVAGRPIGPSEPLFLIAGPCVVEDQATTLAIAEALVEMTAERDIPLIFKASFDKANRSSATSYRGPGMAAGLEALAAVRERLGVEVITDVHEYTPLDEVASVVDWLQIPAFLCRQTDFIQAVAAQGRGVNIKKGQFLAPWDMANVVAKARETGNERITVCERGVSFGYNNLVADMRSLAVMRDTQAPVVFDATHSVQLPGGQGHGTCPGGGGRGRQWPFHGDPSQAGSGPIGRAQQLATGSTARLARCTDRPRCRGQAPWLSRIESNQGDMNAHHCKRPRPRDPRFAG